MCAKTYSNRCQLHEGGLNKLEQKVNDVYFKIIRRNTCFQNMIKFRASAAMLFHCVCVKLYNNYFVAEFHSYEIILNEI